MSLEYLECLGHLFSRFLSRSVFLVSIREPRGFEDRAEVAVAHRCRASVIAICLPNASAKVVIKSIFCWDDVPLVDFADDFSDGFFG